MLTLDIAGRQITYKTITELNAKMRDFLSEAQQKRLEAENQFKQWKAHEHILQKFLGNMGGQGAVSGETHE